MEMLDNDAGGKKTDLPQLLVKWEKNDSTKQSAVFTKEECARFLV